MNDATDGYNRRVWQFLEKMKPGQRHKVNDLAAEETKDKFIEAIKEYMASFPFDGWISFNADYTEFYRSPPVPFQELKDRKRMLAD